MSKPKGIKLQILELREQGLSYSQISKKLKCSKSSVCFHCGNNQKTKSNNRAKANSKTKLYKKVSNFLRKKHKEIIIVENKFGFDKCLYWKVKRFIRRISMSDEIWNTEQLLDKIKANPRCGLTGKYIDINDTKSWHLDHIIPVSRGGSNSIDNCEILCANVNQAKHNMTNEEFIQLCKDVLIYHGYKIEG